MNDSREPFSTEMLNALVDGEVSAAERARLLARLQSDPEARARLCDLRDTKELVQSAYPELPPAPPAVRRHPWRWATAAVLAVAVVTGGVMSLHQQAPPAPRMVMLDPTGAGARPAVAADEALRIVFHVVDPDPQNTGTVLREVESLLELHRQQAKPLRVEIVAHGEGLALLRAGLTRHREHIARLARQHPNLTFVACHNTVNRLRVEDGVEVTLVPEARVTESGVAHLVRRQREGWAYIQV